MSFAFSPENLGKIEKLRSRYPSPKALTLPLLWLVQEQEGYIPGEAFDAIAEITTWSPMDIYKSASFYTMLRFEPAGKYHIKICRSLSCTLCGQAMLYRHLREKLGIKAGETTADGRFTIERVECLGSCGTAPAMQINDIYYEELNTLKLDTILENLP